MIKLFQKLMSTLNYMQKFYIGEEGAMKDWATTLVQIKIY